MGKNQLFSQTIEIAEDNQFMGVRINPILLKSSVSELPSGDKYDGVRAPTVELIGDLLHVSPLALKAVVAAREVADVAFVTDAIAEPVPGKKLR